MPDAMRTLGHGFAFNQKCTDFCAVTISYPRLLKARTSRRHKNTISRHDHRFPVSFFEKKRQKWTIFLLKTPWDNNSVPMSTVVVQ